MGLVALAAIAAAPARAGSEFDLVRAEATPARAFFDERRPIRLGYEFTASRPLDLAIRVARRAGGKVVRRWVERDLAPGSAHRRRWDGRRADGGVAGDGAYEFLVGPLGQPGEPAGRFRFTDHRFPVDGPHAYGDRFGEPRSGGRVHEGQDLVAACGTPLLATRGGRVQARGYSGALYGHWVLIDGRATRTDYFYAHLRAPSPRRDGDRLATGDDVGAVGRTGNARGEFCQLHFELWPRGYRNGSPRNPAAALRRWDSSS